MTEPYSAAPTNPVVPPSAYADSGSSNVANNSAALNAYTNPDGTFNSGGSAANAAATDPASLTTDIYGLTKADQQWNFFNYATYADSPHYQNAAQNQMAATDQATTPSQNPDHGTNAVALMKYYSGMAAVDPQGWANTQRQLLAMGAYGNSGSASEVRFGIWMPGDARALKEAMFGYQQQAGKDGAGLPITFSEYVDGASGQVAANGQVPGNSVPGGTNTGGRTAQTQMTDPAYLSLYAQKAAQASLGHDLSRTQLDQFISEFHAAEQSNQVAAADGAAKVTGSDARAEAVNFVQANMGTQVAQHQTQGYMNALLNQFLPGASGKPNIPTDPYSIGY